MKMRDILPVLGDLVNLAELSPKFRSRQYDDTLSTRRLHSAAENLENKLTHICILNP